MLVETTYGKIGVREGKAYVAICATRLQTHCYYSEVRFCSISFCYKYVFHLLLQHEKLEFYIVGC